MARKIPSLSVKNYPGASTNLAKPNDMYFAALISSTTAGTMEVFAFD
jgi:hypothetical protein